MFCAKLILLGVFACPHQVPQRFVCRIWYPDWSQIARTIVAGQLLSITSIRLYPISSLRRNQGRRHHFTAQLLIASVANTTHSPSHRPRNRPATVALDRGRCDGLCVVLATDAIRSWAVK